MTKAPNTIRRMKPLAGMSVREIAQAIGTPNMPASSATPVPSSSELRIARRCGIRP